MKLLKNIAIFVPTALIILFCGMLPTISGQVQDSLDGQNVTFAEMKTVQFSKEVTDFEKLFLMCYGDMVDVSDERTRFKERELEAHAKELLDPYVNAGLIPTSLEEFSFSASPRFLYMNDSSEISGIFWLVDMKYDYSKENISMCIDDQDGDLMLVSYDCLADRDIYESIGMDLDELMNIFCDLYFQQVDMFETVEIKDEEKNAFEQYTDSYGNNMGTEFYGESYDAVEGTYGFYISGGEQTKSTSSVWYHLEDWENGNLDLRFNVYTRGFYNEFDASMNWG